MKSRLAGFHTAGSGGNANGIGSHIRTLLQAGIPPVVVCADGIVGIGDALSHAGEPILAYRVVRDGQETYAVPNYSLSPLAAAQAYYNLVFPFIPQEVKDNREKIWILLGNELDKNRSNWLGEWATFSAEIWNAQGYKVLHFGFSSGEPEPEHWRAAGMLSYLEYCEQNPTMAGVALHEYSFTTEGLVGDGNLIGRYRDLYAACDENGIDHPFVAITEFGWTHENVPSPVTAIMHIDAVFNQYPDYPPAAIWYLGPGFDNIANKTQPLIEPLTQYLLDTTHEEIEPMTTRGAPRTQYKRIYVLLPPTATSAAWATAVAEATMPRRFTIGYSADDAGIGDLDEREVVAVNPADWGDSLEMFYANEYPGIMYIPVNAATPEILKASLQYYVQYGSMPPEISARFDSPVGTFSERESSTVWPTGWIDATGYLTYYTFGSNNTPAYHTGADLNKNVPTWNWDRGQPVYATADGTVTYARLVSGSTWGRLIVIRHPLPDGTIVYSRYAHLATMTVSENQIVSRGQQIGTIGGTEYGVPDHLHFDISTTSILGTNPTNWPGGSTTARNFILNNYVDPLQYILSKKASAPVEPEHFPAGPEGTIHIVEGLPNNPSSRYTAYNDPALQVVNNQRSLYGQDSLSDKDAIVIHHSVGLPTTPPESIAIGHINRNGGGVEGWPGIGYDYYIMGDGRIFRTNYLGSRNFHAGTWNRRSVGICLAGSFMGSTVPSTTQLASCRSLVNWLKNKLGNNPQVLKHRDVAATACPGDTWASWWEAATGEATSQPPSTYPDVGVFIRGVDQPASDWYWPTAKAVFDRTGLRPKFHSNGTNRDWYNQYKHPDFNLVRVVIGRSYNNRDIDALWNELSLQIGPWYFSGERRFVFLNEPNTYHEHVGKLWDNSSQFVAAFNELIDRARATYSGIKIWYPGMSPGGDGAGTQWQWNDAALSVIGRCDGVVEHVYSGITNDASGAAQQMYNEVVQFQQRYAQTKPLVIGEFSVNRPASALYKAQTYNYFYSLVGGRRGIKAAYSFSASWHPAEDPNSEGWLEGGIDVAYAAL